MIQFYKGKRTNYDSEAHGEGIYFTNDSGEILVDGQSYGGATAKDIEAKGGTWTSTFSNAGLLKDGKLPKNITLTEILEKLLRQESFPSQPKKTSTASLTTSLAGINVSLSKTGTQEVGTPVTINAITMSNTTYGGTATTTVGTFTYGYSEENDNSVDNTAKTISVSRSTPAKAEGSVHSMNVTINGFGLTTEAINNNKPQPNADATQVKFNAMQGTVQKESNSVSATASGVTYTATVDEIPSKYVVSNFGNTSESHKSEYVAAANLSSTPTSVSGSASVTGVFGIYSNGTLYGSFSSTANDSAAYTAASKESNTKFSTTINEDGEYPVTRLSLTTLTNGSSTFYGYIGFGLDDPEVNKYVYLPEGWKISTVHVPHPAAAGQWVTSTNQYATRIKGDGEAEAGFDFTNNQGVESKYTKWRIVGSTAPNLFKLTITKA